MNPKSGIGEKNRILLERLHRSISGPFDAAKAGKALDRNTPETRRLLAYFASRGWLARVRPGLYTTVPLGADAPSQWREDPWAVAVAAFSPCYIGGWSACEYWALTEQIFREIVVITARQIGRRKVIIQETPFLLKVLPVEKHFGTRPVWRGQSKIQVTDPSRTVVDILDDPRLGGGIQHVSQVVASYFGGEHRDASQLLNYAKRLGNRTVFKRLGFLLESLEISKPEVLAACLERQSAGLSWLDPTGPKDRSRIVKRWNLRVNTSVARTEFT
jgi:predicted transcriptional regulator of viral defense system